MGTGLYRAALLGKALIVRACCETASWQKTRCEKALYEAGLLGGGFLANLFVLSERG